MSHGAKIINMSLGGDIDGNQALENAIRNAVAQGVLVVISAGNEGEVNGAGPNGGASPTEPAYIAGEAASLGRVVAVGAVDANRNMPTFSNRAAQTANFYILAPGVSVPAAGVDDNVRLPNDPTCAPGQTTGCNDTDNDGDYWLFSGTSVAAPHVAGALALMLDLFPNITPENALHGAAGDGGRLCHVRRPIPCSASQRAPAIDAVGGRGILNLARAFSPIGTMSISLRRETWFRSAMALAGPSGALGDWIEHSGAFDGLVFQDMYERGFRIGEAQMIAGTCAFLGLPRCAPTMRAGRPRRGARAGGALLVQRAKADLRPAHAMGRGAGCRCSR